MNTPHAIFEEDGRPTGVGMTLEEAFADADLNASPRVLVRGECRVLRCTAKYVRETRTSGAHPAARWTDDGRLCWCDG